MTRLRYPELTGAIGTGGLTSSATSHTFAAPLTYSGGTTVPTLSGSDYFMVTIGGSILDSPGTPTELVQVTAYNSSTGGATLVRGALGTTASAHAASNVVTQDLHVLDQAGETAWTAPTFTNSWVNEGSGAGAPAGFRKDSSGMVHLRGLIKNASSSAPGSSAFTLPAGYRPPYPLNVPVFCANASPGTANVLDQATVGTDGTVKPSGNFSYVWQWLDGISFYTD